MRAPVERGVNCADLGTGKEEVEMFVAVASENGDTVTFFNAL